MYPIEVVLHNNFTKFMRKITVLPNFRGMLIIVVIIEGALLSYGYHGINHL